MKQTGIIVSALLLSSLGMHSCFDDSDIGIPYDEAHPIIDTDTGDSDGTGDGDGDGISDGDEYIKENLELISNIFWINEYLRNGMEYKKAEFTVFDSKQTVYLVEFDSTYYSTNIINNDPDIQTVSTVGAAENAYVAINGSFFNTSGDYETNTFFKLDGVEITGYAGVTDFGELVSTGAISISGGSPTVHTWSGGYSSIDLVVEKETIIATGPLLVYKSDTLSIADPDPWGNMRNPRTLMAISEDSKVVFMVVDGGIEGVAEGMTVRELALFAYGMGYKYAINLDGEGSTTMWIRGRGVVNTPSEGSERLVRTVLTITD